MGNGVKDLEHGKSRQDVMHMHQRKAMMLERSDAVVAMPGGTGTFEELFEAITLKRLGIYLKPIVLLDVNGSFAPCIELLERCDTADFKTVAKLIKRIPV